MSTGQMFLGRSWRAALRRSWGWLGLFLLLLAAAPSQAGVYIVTGIGITTSQVNTYHYMEADSTTAYYYDVEVDGFIHRDSGPGTSYSVIKSGYATGGAYAEKTLSNSKTNNRGYIAQSNYWLYAYYWYTVNSTIIFQDYLGYGLINPGGYGGNGSVNAPGTYYELYSNDIYIASAYLGDNTYLPSISAIVVTGSPVRGGSGYIEVYGANLAKWAGPTTATISGSGVTASVIYQNYLNPGQVNLSYSISSSASTGNRNLTVTTPFGTSNTKTFTIYDHTPVISAMPHNYWGAGGTTVVEIYGQWFGTNPQVNITGNGVGTPIVDYKSDTQINVRVPINNTAADGNGTLTVTASNMNGGMFQQQPGGGGSQTSANATILSKNSFSMKLEIVGFGINTSNNYSEDTTVRIAAVRNANGAALQGWTGVVPIREDGTSIYSQNGGSLPPSVTIPYGSGGATTTFPARSLANPSGNAAPAAAQITTTVTSGSTGFFVFQQNSLAVPQWVISGNTIDSKLCSVDPIGQQMFPYDWIQYRLRDIRTSATGDAATVLGHVACYSVKALTNADGIAYWDRQNQSPIAINPYRTYQRLDSTDGATSCGTTTDHKLRNVYLHEARHAYQGYRASVANNDQDGDFLPANAHPVAPGSIMIDSTTARTVCNFPSTVAGKTYKGDSNFDIDVAPDNASYAWQHDAFQFAASHD